MVNDSVMSVSFTEDFSLPDQDGQTVVLSRRLSESKGTVVLSFRGHW